MCCGADDAYRSSWHSGIRDLRCYSHVFCFSLSLFFCKQVSQVLSLRVVRNFHGEQKFTQPDNDGVFKVIFFAVWFPSTRLRWKNFNFIVVWNIIIIAVVVVIIILMHANAKCDDIFRKFILFIKFLISNRSERGGERSSASSFNSRNIKGSLIVARAAEKAQQRIGASSTASSSSSSSFFIKWKYEKLCKSAASSYKV